MPEFHELALERQIEYLTELASAALPSLAIPEGSRLTLLNFRENAVFRIDHAESGAPYVSASTATATKPATRSARS